MYIHNDYLMNFLFRNIESRYASAYAISNSIYDKYSRLAKYTYNKSRMKYRAAKSKVKRKIIIRRQFKLSPRAKKLECERYTWKKGKLKAARSS